MNGLDPKLESIQILKLVRRNVLLILLCTLACCALMWHQLSLAVPQYTARATLVLDDAVLRLDPFGARLRARTLTQVQLATEVEIMRSREFAARMVTHLAADQGGGKETPFSGGVAVGEDVINGILESYQITWHPSTLAIDILSRADTPQSAADIANEVARAYLDYTLDAQLAHVAQTMGAVLTRRSVLQKKLADAETALVDFIRENNLEDPAETETLSANLQRLEAQLALADDGLVESADTEQLQTRLEETRAELDALAAAKVQQRGFERALEAMRRQDDLMSDQIDALETQQTLLTPIARQVTIATPPGRPISPSPNTAMAGALVGGLTLGFIAALLRENARGRLRWPSQVAGLRPRVLGHMPSLGRKYIRRSTRKIRRGRLRRIKRAVSPLFTTLRTAAGERDGALYLVTSPESGEGRSTVSFALAAQAAAEGENVLLVDLDPSRTDITNSLSRVRDDNDFFDLLRSPLQIRTSAIHLLGYPGLSLLSPAPGALPLQFQETHQLLNELSPLRRRYGTIIVDCPPVLLDDTACRLGRVAEMVLLVARMKKTDYDSLSEASGQLEMNHIDKIGIIVNDG